MLKFYHFSPASQSGNVLKWTDAAANEVDSRPEFSLNNQ
jgi:hypothetical protein